jgi:putative transposase
MADALHRAGSRGSKAVRRQLRRKVMGMRRSSLSDAEISDVVRALEAGRPAHELCETWQISMRTLYRWKRKFGGLKPFAVQALRRLEQENLRLRAEAARAAPSGESTPRSPVMPVRSDLGSGDRAFAQPHVAVAIGRYASLRLR